MRRLVHMCALYCLIGRAAQAQEAGPTPDVEDSSGEQTAATLSPDAVPLAAFSEEQRVRNDKLKSEISTLWTGVMLEILTADILNVYIPESMDEYSSFAAGNEAQLMLGGALMMQIPLSMIYLSRVLPYKANRWVNTIAVGLTTAWVVGGGSLKPHYVVCASAEIATLSLITWKTFQLTNPDREDDRPYSVGLDLNPRQETYGVTYSYTF